MSEGKPRPAPGRPSVLRIRLGDYDVGTITQLGGFDKNLFVFDEEYAADERRPILSLSFLDIAGNLRVTEQLTRSKLPPFFSNLLPEGALRQYIARHTGVHSEHEFAFLLMLGRDLPGNVSAEDIDGRLWPELAGVKGAVQPVSRAGAVRFSLSGVQMKFSPAATQTAAGAKLTIPVTGEGGEWIVKLPTPHYPMLPENEFAMMWFASHVGIRAPEFSLVEMQDIEGLPDELREADQRAYLVRRFDRTASGGRIHMEDFNQVFGQFPAEKYEKQSFTAVARVMAHFLDEDGQREFVRRLIFMIGTGNMDMHLKNWTFLYPDGRTPTLSPAYDFISTVVYPGVGRKLALSLNKEKDPRRFTPELLDDFAQKAGFSTGLVRTTARETVDAMIAGWKELGKEGLLSKAWRAAILDYVRSVPYFASRMAMG